MKKLLSALLVLGGAFLLPMNAALAASNTEIDQFTHSTLTGMIALASIVAAFFLIRGGYLYITSTGKPQALLEAKQSIRNALLGLVIVIGAGVFSSLLNQAFTAPAAGNLVQPLVLQPIQPVSTDFTLAQIILDAVSGLLKTIVQSATKPILDGIMNLLTSTPSLVTNSVVFNFWLTMVGITDSLFVLIIALLGFQVMSASSFGFEELTLKELLPRLALAFLGINTSIFLVDWLVGSCQVLIQAVLHSTGGLGQAWILNAFDPAVLTTGTTALVTLIFMVVFVILAVVLLLFYISRLMILALGAILSPLIWLLWVTPKFTGFAESAFRAYLVMIYSLFIHVVIIQLASAFFALPNQAGTNPLVSILVGIALLSLLLKTTSATMQLVLASQATGSIQKIGGQVMNVLAAGATKAAKVIQ